MLFNETDIDGLWQVVIERYTDTRGSFGRTFCDREFATRGLTAAFIQASSSRTRQAATVRGMHWQQTPNEEAKLIRCVRGAIYDVVCDLRPSSVTYMQYRGFHLNQDDDYMIYVPAGCAHGFQTLTDDVEVLYAMSSPFVAQASAGFRFDDPAFAIEWPLAVSCIADKDLAWPPFVPPGPTADQIVDLLQGRMRL
jgi:dTDP-4-dehydrorhamnose 3,5-epimerase